MKPGQTGRTGLAALLELLRAPLLLSPAADVFTGWLLVLGFASQPVPRTSLGLPTLHWPSLLLGAAAACCLLAAGMAQNALADLPDDRRRKPERPLPRGALPVSWARGAWLICSLLALGLLLAQPHVLNLGLLIVVLTTSYHYLLKSRRVPGCLNLAVLRGLCMGMGVVTARDSLARIGSGADLGPALFGCVLYAGYIFGASLHASTDDEPDADGPWSGLGLTLCSLVLVAWGLIALARLGGAPGWGPLLGLLLCLAALLRLRRAIHDLPSPAVTGTALSGLHLLHAAVVSLAGGPLAAALVLLLFAANALMLRVYPPS